MKVHGDASLLYSVTGTKNLPQILQEPVLRFFQSLSLFCYFQLFGPSVAYPVHRVWRRM